MSAPELDRTQGNPRHGDWGGVAGQSHRFAVAGFASGLFAAGYLSFLSHPLHLFVPSTFAALLLAVPNRLAASIEPRLFVLVSALFLAVLASALFGASAGIRAIGFAVFSCAPLFLLALNPGPAITGLAQTYGTAAVIAMVVWSWLLYAFLGGTLGPWGSWTPAGSGNLYGLQFNLLWPVLLYISLSEKSAATAGALRALAAIAFLFALLTFSRAAIVCAISIATMLALRGGWWKTLTAVSVTVALAATQVQAWLTFARILEFEPTLGRFAIWKQSLAVAQNNLLFGVSPGGATDALSAIQVYHAHSNLFNFLLESGIAAAALYLMLQIWLAILTIRLVRAGVDLACLGGAIGAWLATSQVSTTITNPELTLTLALVAAFAGHELRRIAGLTLQFLLAVMVARAIGQTGYGIFASSAAIAAIISTISCFGLPMLLTRDLSRNNDSEKVADILRSHLSVGGLLTVAAVLVLALVMVAAPNLTPILAVSASLFVPLVVAQFRQSVALVLKPSAIALAPEQIAAPLLAVILLALSGGFTGRTVAAVAGITTAASILSTLAASPSLLRHAFSGPAINATVLAQLLSQGLPFFLAQFPRLLFANADILLIGLFLGVKEAGAYALASRIAALASLPLFAVNTACQPLFAASFAKGDVEESSDLAIAAAFLSLVGSLIAASTVLLAGNTLIGMAGPDFAVPPFLLPLLVTAHLANGAFGPNGMVLLMSGHENKAAAGAWLQSILMIVLTASFAASGNLLAASTGVVIAMVAGNLLMSVLLFWYTGLKLHPFANSAQRSLSVSVLRR
jgi:O-antigen/teichoic acid export membrane protein